MKKLLMLLILPLFLLAEMEFSDPKPTFENPRKWFLKLSTSDLKVVNKNLDAINNVLKEYPTETLQVAVITYASGMRVIRKDYDPKTLSRIDALRDYGVEFVACINTMNTMGWKREEFIDDLTYAQAGIAEAIERAAGGWIDVTPYTTLHEKYHPPGSKSDQKGND